MTTTVVNIIPPKLAEAAGTPQYTAVNCKCIIDKFTATNISAANVTFTVFLVPSTGAAGAANTAISARAIAPGETYTCPELVGQVLESGGSIVTNAGTASALSINAAGRQIT